MSRPILRLRGFLLLLFVAFATSGAAPPVFSSPVTLGDRVALCGSALADVNPGLYLPGELSTLVEEGCPKGSVLCPAACCVQSGCCNPTIQACCDATCTYACILGKACVAC